MNQKVKNSIIIAIFFILLVGAASAYIITVQKEKLDEKEAKLEELKATYSSMETLLDQLANAEQKVAVIDSALSQRKFIIPQNLPQEKFYEFVDDNYTDLPVYKFVSIDFKGEIQEDKVKYYSYKVDGIGSFESVYRLLYAIEHSKELKKIETGEVSGNTTVDKSGNPKYLVKFQLEVKTYFADNDQFSSTDYVENKMNPRSLYDAFYPLIRTEIKANTSNLPDIQDAELLFLYPDGAFLKDTRGNTFMLKEGDQVYLGYVTTINYKNKSVSFILNKGGIVEYYTIEVNSNKSKRSK